MKTILVLTDLSAKAEHAALQALPIAQKLQANIILYNAFGIAEMLPVNAAGFGATDDYAVFDDESKNGLQQLAHLLEDQASYSGFKPAIETMNDLGNLGSRVNQIVEQNHVDLVIMGSRSNNQLSHFLFGSESATVLEYASCPVLFIPEQLSIGQIKKMVYAIDSESLSQPVNHLVVALARAFGATVDCVHITDSPKLAAPELETFMSHNLGDADALKLKAEFIEGTNVEAKLKSYINNVNADMLVMVHRKHGIFNRLIFGTHSGKMLNNNSLPLLVLPG